MRRREKFVIVAILLSILLFGVLMTPSYWRFLAIFGFGLISYLMSVWSLSEDLQYHELLTIIPLPTMYSLAVSSLYFVLPENIINRVLLLVFFGIGMYGLLLTGNIFSVAKGRTIQLLYAAQTVSIFFTLMISFVVTNTILSLNFPLWLVSLVIGVAHFPLVISSIWSVRLYPSLDVEEWLLSGLITVAIVQFVVALALIPFAAWVIGVLVMSILYIQLGLAQSYLRGRLFSRTLKEYSLVGIFVLSIFILLFPGK